jgi:PKD repeat protein
MKSFQVLSFSLMMMAGVIPSHQAYSQVIADFEAPDTVSTGQQISLINLSQGGTTYYWSFCSGSIKETPVGTNIGNPGYNLDVPTYITLVKEGNNCFSFISNQGRELYGYASVTRNYHGDSFLNYPATSVSLGDFGILGTNCEGIQIKKDNATWYGFVSNDHSIVRLDFGNSLFNTPVATDIPISVLHFAHGLWIGKEGNDWVGFIACSYGNKLVRLDFGNSLGNIPAVHDFGNLGGLIYEPGTIAMIKENSDWHMFSNGPDSSLVRLDFSNSLFNNPSVVNLGNPGGAFTHGGGLNFLQDCETTTGYLTKYIYSYPGADMIYRLDFAGGFTDSLTAIPLGNIGEMDRAHTNSEIVREGDKYVCYITNRASATMTRLTWQVCSNPSVQNSSLFTPPPFSYDQPGIYSIRLTVDDGLETETSVCKTVTVLDCQAPVSGFTFNSYHLLATFTNTSSPAATWHWDFGDGTGSEEKDPSHYFPVQGSYNVCLTASDSCGSSTDCQEVNIACIPPEANFIFSMYFPEVYFSDTSATTIFISRLWDFGDGTTSVEKNPTHIYSQSPGVYNACLTINDSCGLSTFCQPVYYFQPMMSHFTTSTDQENDRLVYFTDETNGATSWHWDFGDGNYSAARNPVHLFPAFDKYNVCLTTGNSVIDTTFCDSVNIMSIHNSSWLNIATLFPNPASGQFFIGLTKGAANAKFLISDLTGMILKEISYTNILSSNPVAIDISAFASGIYFVKFRFDNYEKTWKLIIR